MAQPQGAHLVGSVNYDDAETTMRKAAGILGARLKRIPDGEPGPRFHWIMFQPEILAQADGIERVGDEPVMLRMLDIRPVRVADGVDPASVVFPPLGYAKAARESYAIFTRIRDEGVIAPGVRFQVSLPTPLAVVGAYFPAEQRAGIEPAYRAAMYRELDDILAAIPHDDLAIQWDNAVEFGIIEHVTLAGGELASWWGDDVWAGLTQRSAEQADRVPADVEVGFHLCYGDVAEKHFVEPTDAANLVRFANMLVTSCHRHVNWLHMPVPISRDDDAYFAPLSDLAIGDTELYLGLVHREDGAEGARRRIAAAQKHVQTFGVATECGIGRAPEGSTDGILRTHADVASAW